MTHEEALLKIKDLEDKLKEAEAPRTFGEARLRMIERALSLYNNNKVQAAKSLGITVKTLYNYLHEFGIYEKYASRVNHE